MSEKFKSTSLGKLFLYMFLGVVAIIQIYPFIWLVLFSFKNNDEIFGGNVAGLPKKFLWKNYLTAMADGKLQVYMLNSIVVTVVTILMTLIIACMASYAIARMKWRFSKSMLSLFLLGVMIPINATLLPLLIFFKQIKILNTHMSLILPYIGFSLPMAIYIFTGFLKGIPYEMEESSLLDGCTIYGTFFKIIAPIMKPALATVTIFTFIFAWNELMFASTFISDSSLKTLTVGVMEMVGQDTTDWGPIGAGLVIASLPTIIIYSVMSKQVQKSLIAGAVKG